MKKKKHLPMELTSRIKQKWGGGKSLESNNVLDAEVPSFVRKMKIWLSCKDIGVAIQVSIYPPYITWANSEKKKIQKNKSAISELTY